MSKTDSKDFVKHSKPIPIGTTHSRHRSASTSSSSDSSSEPQTPLSNNSPPRMIPTNLSPTNSPILSYFIGHSPTKTATFPFNRNFPNRSPVFEEDETDTEVPVATHARRASTAAAGRFGPQQPTPVIPDPQNNRGSGLLRRLSLGNALAKPPNGVPTERMPSPRRTTTPPNTAVNPSANGAKMPAVSPRGTRSRRSATLSVDGAGKPRRAPSPMGERILKGHFDGFN